MPFQIRHDGKTYTVRTEVGNGLTKVHFDEDMGTAGQQREAQPEAANQQEARHG